MSTDLAKKPVEPAQKPNCYDIQVRDTRETQNTMAEEMDLEQRLENLEEEIRLLKESVFPLIADIRVRVLSPGDEF